MRIILLINPRIRKIAQKNSANITSCNDTEGPKPIGSAKLFSLSLKCVTFDHPCDTNMREVPTLNRSRPKSKENGACEKTIFFIGWWSTFVFYKNKNSQVK